jgi:hypothetical protein
MRFFKTLELRLGTLICDDLEAFKTHGVVRTVFVATAGKTGLKGEAHQGSSCKTENNFVAISCHSQSDASIVSGAARTVSNKFEEIETSTMELEGIGEGPQMFS